MTDSFRHAYALHGLHWVHATIPIGIVLTAAVIVASVVGMDRFWIHLLPLLPVIAVIVVAAAPVSAFALARHGLSGIGALSIVAGLLVLNFISLSLPRVGPFVGLDWNWQGKTLDLVWCLALIWLLSPDMRREIGWTWKTRQASLLPALINIGILVAIGYFVFGLATPGDMARRTLSLEQVLFDTTYPNLVEEIVFRGFMLALLDRAFPPKWSFGGAYLGWGIVITSMLFGLVHGIAVGPDGSLVFEPLWLVMTFAAGFALGYIRALTGSLWPAFLGHCAPEAGILLALWLH